MNGRQLEFYEQEVPVDEDMQAEIDEEIARVPKAPSELQERLDEHHSSSPRDSGGDIDAQWEEVNTSGSEAVFGHNPTPDQSDVEENAHAMGIDFADNEPLTSRQTPHPLIWLARRLTRSSVRVGTRPAATAAPTACSASITPGTIIAGWPMRAR